MTHGPTQTAKAKEQKPMLPKLKLDLTRIANAQALKIQAPKAQVESTWKKPCCYNPSSKNQNYADTI